MAKLIICCDGTWNDPVDQTHVWRLYQAAQKIVPDPDRCTYYDKGVGTDETDEDDRDVGGWRGPAGNALGWLDRVAGGAFGTGISRNIRQAYTWLAKTYQPGDEIYIFGFSRGAYTVRSLCGFIKYAGLMLKDDLGENGEGGEFTEIRQAYTAYRTPDESERNAHPWLSNGAAQRARKNLPIQFLGVFDTVGALGVPVGWIERARNSLVPEKSNRFHNTQLGPNVKFACHALAIDERRGPFKPTLWTGAIGPHQRVLQVWFAGVHSDVGGGYPDKQLADVALEWMLGEASWAGLDLREGFEPDSYRPSPAGEIHESVSLGYRLALLLPSIDLYRRPIGSIQRRSWFGGEPPTVPGERLHWSVVDRVQGAAAQVLLEANEMYRPPSLVPRGKDKMQLTDVEIHGQGDTPHHPRTPDRKAS